MIVPPYLPFLYLDRPVSNLDYTNQVFSYCYCCGFLDVDSRDILKGGIKL